MTKKDEGRGGKLGRRGLLKGLGGAVAVAAVGCGSDDEAQVDGPGGVGGGSASGGSGGAGQGAGGSTGGGGVGGGGGSGQGPSCEGSGGLSAEELLAPIDTIVVLCMENRSFDHNLGGSYGIEEGRVDVDGLTGSESNPHPDGGVVQVFKMSNLAPDDPPHEWDSCHEQYNQGALDSFVRAHINASAGSSPEEVMGYYRRWQVPSLHELADSYALCNRYFCSLLGPTWPNRLYLHGATSKGRKTNLALAGFKSIWPVLKDAGLSVRNYNHGIAWATGAYAKLSDLSSMTAFKQDAADGKLPNFSIIDPEFFGGGANDEHPQNANVPLGQLLISDVYDTLAKSPQWNRCLLVITYDEHGGFYDHVPPPLSGDADPDFSRLGFRVPSVVVGPYTRRGCAINTVFDHVSVLATLQTRWKIPAFNNRMNQTADFSSCIDPELVKNKTPQAPAILSKLRISQDELRKHFDQIKRGIVPPNHPEITQSLKDQGIYRMLEKGIDREADLKRRLDDAVRRGLADVI